MANNVFTKNGKHHSVYEQRCKQQEKWSFHSCDNNEVLPLGRLPWSDAFPVRNHIHFLHIWLSMTPSFNIKTRSATMDTWPTKQHLAQNTAQPVLHWTDVPDEVGSTSIASTCLLSRSSYRHVHDSRKWNRYLISLSLISTAMGS